MKKYLAAIAFVFFLTANGTVYAFDHAHTLWNILLSKHVVLINNGNASQVNYAGFQKDHSILKNYLKEL